jgi:hypothetical protein
MKNTKKQDKTTVENIQVNNDVEVQVNEGINEGVNEGGDKLLTFANNPNFVSFTYPQMEVQLDMYADIPDTFLGKLSTSGGVKQVMLNKYNDDSTYFDINNFISKKIGYKTLFLSSGADWVDAGTVMPYRYEAFTQDPAEPFTSRTKVYTSNIIFVSNGYTRSFEDNDLERLGYVYDFQSNNFVLLLTNQPTKQYIQGQTEFLNFVLKDAYHGQGANTNLGIKYSYYTYSGEEITSENRQLKGKNDMNIVNTIKLLPDIEMIQEEFEKEVGYFTVSLIREGTVISNNLKFDVISNCYNKIVEYAFLNRLGGWSSFNFNNFLSTQLTSTRNTIYKNQLPTYDISDEIEKVTDIFGQDDYTVKSNYINLETIKWLREFALSKAVYELSTKRYIVVDEFNISYSTAKEKFQVTMKYHYSDSINNNIK